MEQKLPLQLDQCQGNPVVLALQSPQGSLSLTPLHLPADVKVQGPEPQLHN